MNLETYEHTLARLCLACEAAEADLDALGGRPDRWLLYRAMVRTRLQTQARAGLPRTAAALGRPAFETVVADYLAEQGVRTRFIRDVVAEVAAFALPRWRDAAGSGAMPPHLPELAAYEAAVWAVRNDPAEPRDRLDTVTDLRFDRALAVNPARRLLRLRFAVEALSPGDPGPAALPVLALYRPPGRTGVRQLRLDAAVARLVDDADRDRRPLADRVRDLSRETTVFEITPQRLADLAQTLATGVADGLVLGSFEP